MWSSLWEVICTKCALRFLYRHVQWSLKLSMMTKKKKCRNRKLTRSKLKQWSRKWFMTESKRRVSNIKKSLCIRAKNTPTSQLEKSLVPYRQSREKPRNRDVAQPNKAEPAMKTSAKEEKKTSGLMLKQIFGHLSKIQWVQKWYFRPISKSFMMLRQLSSNSVNGKMSGRIKIRGVISYLK